MQEAKKDTEARRLRVSQTGLTWDAGPGKRAKQIDKRAHTLPN